jgi:hypothetical protein
VYVKRQRHYKYVFNKTFSAFLVAENLVHILIHSGQFGIAFLMESFENHFELISF